MVAELRALEKLMAEDDRKTAADRFQQRMRQLNAAHGYESADGPSDGTSDVKVLRLTPRMVDYVAHLLEGQHGLEADLLRIGLDLPLPHEESVSAAQGADGQMHSLSSSLCSRTTQQRVHPFSRRRGSQTGANMAVSRQSVALTA